MVAKTRRTSRRAAPRAAAPKGAAIINTRQQIWLAGLGALARAQSEGPKLFQKLVEEGEAVHERQRDKTQRFVKDTLEGLREGVETRAQGVREKASKTLENLEEIFQTRVKKALQQLGMPTSEEIHALSRKVNELNRSVQTLTRTAPAANKQEQGAADQGALL